MSQIWEKVKEFQRQTFQTVTGLEFTYEVSGEKVTHSRSKVTLSKSDFDKAIMLNPHKPSDFHNVVPGPPYVYAIITDDRMK